MKVAAEGGRAAGTLSAGTTLTDSAEQYAYFQSYATGDKSTWFNYKCSGYRFNNDDNSALKTFKVNEEIEYDAGYRAWNGPGATTTAGATPTPTSTFKYLVLDSALALAVSSATAYSVASLMY